MQRLDHHNFVSHSSSFLHSETNDIYLDVAKYLQRHEHIIIVAQGCYSSKVRLRHERRVYNCSYIFQNYGILGRGAPTIPVDINEVSVTLSCSQDAISSHTVLFSYLAGKFFVMSILSVVSKYRLEPFIPGSTSPVGPCPDFVC
jgi:hypothetical protein